MEVRLADYDDQDDGETIVAMLDAYARDPMGGGTGLRSEVKDTLVAGLRKCPTAFTVLAFVDGVPAGLANCFEGFSTFKARPLVNIHDLAVHPDFRRRGVAGGLLDGVASEAARRGSCKITLEVLEGNEPARVLYERHGFQAYALDPTVGNALFLERPLP